MFLLADELVLLLPALMSTGVVQHHGSRGGQLLLATSLLCQFSSKIICETLEEGRTKAKRLVGI